MFPKQRKHYYDYLNHYTRNMYKLEKTPTVQTKMNIYNKSTQTERNSSDKATQTEINTYDKFTQTERNSSDKATQTEINIYDKFTQTKINIYDNSVKPNLQNANTKIDVKSFVWTIIK